MRARVHNAKACTFDGRDCWIASIEDSCGLARPVWDNVSDHDTEQEAIDWARARLQLLGVEEPRIYLADGSYIRADLPRKTDGK